MGPQSYLLKEYEEPFKKELPQEVEELLKWVNYFKEEHTVKPLILEI